MSRCRLPPATMSRYSTVRAAQLRVVDRHARLHGHCDARTFEYLDIVAGGSRQRDMILKQLVHDHLDDLIDILERLLRCSTLRDGAMVAERWAVGVVATLIRLDNDFERVGFHDGTSPRVNLG